MGKDSVGQDGTGNSIQEKMIGREKAVKEASYAKTITKRI